MATREEKLAQLRRLDKIAQLRVMDTPQPEVQAEPDVQVDADTERRWYDRPRALIEGATLGLGDELGALAGAGMAKADQLITGRNKDQSFGDIYREMHGQFQDESDRYERNNGRESIALNVAGGLTTGGLSAGKALLAKGTPFLQRALAASGIGAAEGAVAGAASADQGLENRLRGAGMGAAVGGVAGGALTSVGGLVNSLAKRRVAQDLVQPDGRQLPIHLSAQPGESGVADIYRNTVGGTIGGGALRRQEPAFLNEADDAVVAARTQQEALQAQANALKARLASEKNTQALALQDRVGNVKDQSRKAVKAAEEWAEKQGAKEVRQLRTAAVNQALPNDAPQELRQALMQAEPQQAAKALDGWWQENGFRMVKDRDFEWTGDLKNKLDQMVATDPALALQLGDVWAKIPGMTEKMQAAAMKVVKPGQSMTVADMSDAARMVLNEPTHINGDALMAMRNFFARASNDTSKSFNKGAIRSKANKFDDEIRAGLGGNTPEANAFNDHLSRWGSKAQYEKAVGAAKAEGGYFTPKQYSTAGGKSKKATFGEQALQPETSKTIAAEKARKKALADFKERQTLSSGARTQSVKNATQQRLLNRSLETDKQAKALAKQGKKGLKRATEAAKDLHSSRIPNSSIWAKMYKTGILGGAPGIAASGLGLAAAPVSIGMGAAISRGLASKPAQRFAAGQTRFQKGLQRDLDITEKEREILARVLRRGAVQQSTQENN